MPFANFYHGKRVLVTGHTGFKGAWLSEWLLDLGAEVFGLSLEPATEPALFDQLEIRARLNHKIQDIRDLDGVKSYVSRCAPDLVFHLAAQPIVRTSYVQAVETYATNVMGTVNLLESLKTSPRPCAAVFVTTDKCYKNKESDHAYAEFDELGGHDPYSSSKACAELAIESFRNSFFNPAVRPTAGESLPNVALASARAGNVIGGGDWATDRILPDCVRSVLSGEPIRVRNRWATRPWQHVLEPLSGYLLLGAKLYQNLADPSRFATAFNFGPTAKSNRTVEELVTEFARYLPAEWIDASEPNAPHEAGLLQVAIEKADRVLQWRPTWEFEQAVRKTAEWYGAVKQHSGREARTVTTTQIAEYVEDAKRAKIFWALG